MTNEEIMDLSCGECGQAGCAMCDAEPSADGVDIGDDEVLWPSSDDSEDDENFVHGDDEVLWPSGGDPSEDESIALDDDWFSAHFQPTGGSIVEALADEADRDW